MPKTYRVAPIGVSQIDQAYPLARPLAPSLDLEAWRALCRKATDRRSPGADGDRIIVATNPLGYVQGLCVASVKESPAEGRVLDVPIFAVASAADEAGVVCDLLQYLQDLGRNGGCGSVRIWTLAQDNRTRFLGGGEYQPWDHGLLVLLAPNGAKPADGTPASDPIFP